VELFPVLLDYIIDTFPDSDALGVAECKLLRLLSKATFLNFDNYTGRNKLHGYLKQAFDKVWQHQETPEELTKAQIKMLLTNALYLIELQKTIHIEICSDKFHALLKRIYKAFPDDLLFGRLYAKTLLLLHGTMQLSLLTDDMIEDTENKRNLDEAQKVIEKLGLKHGNVKLDKNMIVFKLVGTTNMRSVEDLIRKMQEEILRSQQDSWHSIWLRIHLADIFTELGAVSSALIEIDAVLATLTMTSISFYRTATCLWRTLCI